MTDRDALVGAIATHPREDTPRLALADWLEENGESTRAEFVRVQCEAARTRPGTQRRAELLDRADELLAEHEHQWLSTWSEHLVDWGFQRGFLSRVRIGITAFLKYGEELFRHEPIGRLELVDDQRQAFDGSPEPLDAEAVREVVAHPAFAFVRDCAVDHQEFLDPTPVSAWLEALAANSKITQLRRFGPVGEFNYNDDGYDGRQPRYGVDLRALTAFCRAAHLRSLRVLNLSQCPVVGRNRQELLAERIASATFARNLRTLKLVNCSLPPTALQRIATAPTFSKLRSLDVYANARDPNDCLPLFQTSTLKEVRHFAIGALNLPAYATSSLARQVRCLTVHGSDDLDRDTELDREAWLQFLKIAPPPLRLELQCHNPGTEVFAAMQRQNWLRDVRELSISGDSQYEVYSGKTAGVCALFSGNTMRRLTTLKLHEVGNRDVLAALATWPGLRRLESLVLTDDYHGRLWLQRFTPQHPPSRLRCLQGVVMTTENEIEQFLALPGLERLQQIHLSLSGKYDRETREFQSQIAPQVAERLIRSKRLANVTSLTLGFNWLRDAEFHVIPLLSDPSIMPRLRTVRLYVSRDGQSDDRAPLDAVRARFGCRLAAW